ncbi:MAG: DUF177 domain-containing protein [Candidatus Margulisbacteria bacterium]|nr:DUF177 domain-containing protein [Candidatus Margulisiibacteriota bacterium]
MKIDLTELLRKAGNEAEIEETEKISFPEDNLNLTKPVKIEAHLTNTGTSVLANGEIDTEAELECSRCLKTFRQPISVKIDETFSRKIPEPKRKGAGELKEEDFVYPIEKDNTIDLTEVVRQNLILALPIKTLCSQNCQGIIKEN